MVNISDDPRRTVVCDERPVRTSSGAVSDHDCTDHMTLHHGQSYMATGLGQGYWQNQYICMRCGAIY